MESINDILRLAAPNKVTINYVSTYGIWGVENEESVVLLEDADIHHNRYLINGYAQTKWVAEAIFRKSRGHGNAVNIYRLGRVTGDSRTGNSDPSSFTNRLIQGCIELGAAPDMDVMMDMTPVDFGARAIAYIGINNLYGEDWHIMNPSPISFKVILSKMQSIRKELELLPADIWFYRLTKAMDKGIANALHPILNHVEQIVAYGGQTAPVYRCDNMLRALDGSNIVCPSIDEELLELYFGDLIRSTTQQKVQIDSKVSSSGLPSMSVEIA